VKTKTKEIQTLCITECRVSTNCPHGGDAGHGGLTYFELKDGGSTCMRVSLVDHRGRHSEEIEVDSVRICLGGDQEAFNLCRLLRWAASELENMLEENHEENQFEERKCRELDPFSPEAVYPGLF
jgi:hypothetical protein